MEKSQFTCLTCHVVFSSSQDQRSHHKTDWHRYNMKRRVADLQPVSASDFAEKVLAQKSKAQSAVEQTSYSAVCKMCQRTYSSVNAYKTHLASKKHRLAASAMQTDGDAMKSDSETDSMSYRDMEESRMDSSDPPPLTQRTTAENRCREIQRQLLEARTEEEVVRLLEEKSKIAPRLDPEHDCLFCQHSSADLEANVEHMTHQHSFFIPDLEYVIDLKGLLAYLGDKISVANLCLYCDVMGGRAFASMEAARRHMQDKGHTKVAFHETDDSAEEFADYYDYSPSWEAAGEAPDEEGADTLAVLNGRQQAFVDQMDLVLPGGQRLGHRSLHRYYKQHLRPTEERESVIINRLVSEYRQLGWQQESAVMTRGRVDRQQRCTDIRRERKEAGMKLKVGMSHNLQRHFRAQMDF